ncbi:hypothetical protein [Falsibacillus pallidus]|uniref:hypothetical protein n=1 Tax=Falsibacillus pallidus TaxID=493781 RepID=UPI003D959708
MEHGRKLDGGDGEMNKWWCRRAKRKRMRAKLSLRGGEMTLQVGWMDRMGKK